MKTPFKKVFATNTNQYCITQWDTVIYSTADGKQASKLLTLLNRNWLTKDENGRDAMRPTQQIINDFLAGCTISA